MTGVKEDEEEDKQRIETLKTKKDRMAECSTACCLCKLPN